MVGGLVEHQHVVSGQQDGRQRHPAPFAAAEFGDVGVEVHLGQGFFCSSRTQQILDDGAGVGFGRPDVVRPAAALRLPVAALAPDDLADGGAGGEVVGLAQITHR